MSEAEHSALLLLLLRGLGVRFLTYLVLMWTVEEEEGRENSGDFGIS